MSHFGLQQLDRSFATAIAKDHAPAKAAPALHGKKGGAKSAKGHLEQALAHHAAGAHQQAKLAALKAVRALHAVTGPAAGSANAAAASGATEPDTDDAVDMDDAGGRGSC